EDSRCMDVASEPCDELRLRCAFSEAMLVLIVNGMLILQTQAQPAKVPELSSMRGCQAGLASHAPSKPGTWSPRLSFSPHRRCFRTAPPALTDFRRRWMDCANT